MSSKDIIKKKQDDQMHVSKLQAAVQLGGGLGMMRGNVKPLSTKVLGRHDLWHGTPVENMFEGPHGKGILEEGLKLNFAGKNKRLNYLLISNAVVRDTEEFLKKNKIAITPEIDKHLIETTQHLLASKKPISDALVDSAEELAKKIKVNPAELKAFYQSKLPELGRRLYFGVDPQGVQYWATKGNELGYATKKMMAQAANPNDPLRSLKNVGESLLEQVTGGFYSDIKSRLAYGSPRETKTVKDLAGLAAELKQYPKAQVIFRSSAPTKTLEYMKDLPVARHLIASLPGMKMMLGSFMPQSDPSKDLSVAEEVASKLINKADIVEPSTGKVIKRINIANAQKSPVRLMGGKGFRLQNLKQSIVPLIMTAAGGAFAYSGLKNLIGAGQEKKGAVNPKTLAKALLVPAGLTAGSLGMTKGVEKLLKIEAPTPMTKSEVRSLSTAEKTYRAGKELEYARKVLPITSAGSGILGALLGAASTKHRRVGAVAGGALGSYLGGALGLDAVMKAQVAKSDPEHSGLAGFVLGKHEKGKQFVKENPLAVAGGEAALTAGLTAAVPYYTASKYYPYHWGLAKQKLQESKAALPLLEQTLTGKTPKILAGSVLLPALFYGAYLGALEAATKGTAAGMKLTEKAMGNEKKAEDHAEAAERWYHAAEKEKEGKISQDGGEEQVRGEGRVLD